jgi:hypothetical protein
MSCMMIAALEKSYEVDGFKKLMQCASFKQYICKRKICLIPGIRLIQLVMARSIISSVSQTCSPLHVR